MIRQKRTANILSEEEIDRQIGEFSAASRGERRKMTGLDHGKKQTLSLPEHAS
jgi:hypothetical protein